MLKNNTLNKDVINKNTINKTNYIVPSINNKEMLIGLMGFFDKVGWINQEKIAYQHLHELDSTDCYLRENLDRYAGQYKALKNIKIDMHEDCP